MTASAIPEDPTRGATPLRIVLIVIGTLMSLGLICYGAYTLLDVAARYAFQTDATFTGVRAIVVNDPAGDVSLSAAPAGAPVAVTANVTEGLFTPDIHGHLWQDGRLVLQASCAGGVECRVVYRVAIPRGIAVTASVSGGTISANGVASATSIQLTSSRGEIRASGLSAPRIILHSGFGEVRAQLATAARRLVATSATSGVSLRVPDTTYSVDASSGTGSVSDRGLRIDPSSPRSIRAHSGIGDVTIRVNR